MIAQTGVSLGTPLLGKAAAATSRIAADAVRNGYVNIAAPADVAAESQQSIGGAFSDFASGPSRESAAGVLGLGTELGGAETPLLTAGVKLAGLRGASVADQKKLLGDTTLQTAESFAAGIPLVGVALAAGLKILATTGEGQRAVAAVGTSEERIYDAQKLLLKGDVSAAVNQAADAFSGGGSSHDERERAFFTAVATRLQDLRTGTGTARTRPTIDAQDVAGFQEALAYGDRMVNGTDLTTLVGAQGTNPLNPTVATAPVDLSPLTAGWQDVKDPTAAGGVRRVWVGIPQTPWDQLSQEEQARENAMAAAQQAERDQEAEKARKTLEGLEALPDFSPDRWAQLGAADQARVLSVYGQRVAEIDFEKAQMPDAALVFFGESSPSFIDLLFTNSIPISAPWRPY